VQRPAYLRQMQPAKLAYFHPCPVDKPLDRRDSQKQPGMTVPDRIHLNVEGNKKVAATLAAMPR
jgi:hypothetical protein